MECSCRAEQRIRKFLEGFSLRSEPFDGAASLFIEGLDQGDSARASLGCTGKFKEASMRIVLVKLHSVSLLIVGTIVIFANSGLAQT